MRSSALHRPAPAIICACKPPGQAMQSSLAPSPALGADVAILAHEEAVVVGLGSGLAAVVDVDAHAGKGAGHAGARLQPAEADPQILVAAHDAGRGLVAVGMGRQRQRCNLAAPHPWHAPSSVKVVASGMLSGATLKGPSW